MFATRFLCVSLFCGLLFPARFFAQADPLPIVPLPQQVERLAETRFSSPETPTFRLSVADEQSVLRSQLSLAWQSTFGKTPQESTSKQPTIWLGIPSENRAFRRACEQSGLQIDERWGEEGYGLQITEQQILIAAHSEAGVFYGLQSLRQLLRSRQNLGSLPGLRIHDWPSFANRGVMDDISRGPLPTMAFLKGQVRRLSELKINVLTYYVEHIVRTRSHPGFSPPEAITIAEWKELSDYAARYHIQLLGSFQSLGHFREILAFPQYQHLGATDRMLKPGDPEAIEFLTDIYDELIPIHTSEVFAINCDEAFDLGRGEYAALADSIGIAGIYAQHVNPLIEHVQAAGKRPIMWGDIALAHPEVLDLIPKETLIGTWEYSDLDNYDAYFDPFLEKGFDVWICTGVLNSYRTMPDLDMAWGNIRGFTQAGLAKGAKGVLTTVWDDGGRHFFSRDWYGVVLGAEHSWHPHDGSRADYDQRFSEASYGDQDQWLPRLIHHLSRLGTLAPSQEMTTEPLFQQLIPARGERIKLSLEGWEQVRSLIDSAAILIAGMEKSGHYAPLETQAWKLIFMQYDQMYWERNLLIQAADTYAKACREQVQHPDSARIHLQEIQLGLGLLQLGAKEVKEAFESLWLQENRTYWLEEALEPYQARQESYEGLHQRLQLAAARLKDGGYLPPPNQVGLDIQRSAGKYFTYWMISGPFPIDTPHQAQADFLVNMGGEAKVRPLAGEYFEAPDGRTLMWDKYQSPFFERVDLTKIYAPHTEMVAYAYCRLQSPQAQRVRATFGSNDGIEIFVNGEKVFEKFAKRSLVPDEDECWLPLEAGRNHILLKIEQWQGDWGFSFRLPEEQVKSIKYKYYLGE